MGRYTFDSQSVQEAGQPRLHTRSRSKSCPFCAETIRFEAIKCRFCGEFLHGDKVHSQAAAPNRPYEDEQDLDIYGEPEPEADVDVEEAEDLEEDDGVLFRARPSLMALLSLILVSGLVCAGCVFVLVYPVETLIAGLPDVNVTPAQIDMMVHTIDYAALTGVVLMGLILLCKIASLKSTCYEVTADRIEWSRGILNRKVDNIDMFRVVDLSLRRTFLDSLLGIGSVKVTAKDESDPVFVFEKIRYCRQLYDAIKKASPEADRKNNVVHLE
ncbi:MAG: PH domain-containing protein [Planctomycetes bacterium]|nr:PH domain-containing protein [Planctomycetota bacterium]